MTPGAHSDGLTMFAVLALAGVGSAIVLALALVALFRRRSRSHLLVALALSTLLARTAVAVLSATGRVGPDLHHVLEHGLDVMMAGLVIAAVYDARSARKSSGAGDEQRSTPDRGTPEQDTRDRGTPERDIPERGTPDRGDSDRGGGS